MFQKILLLGATAIVTALLPVIAEAAVTVTSYSAPSTGTVGSTTDAFDISQGTVITGTSGYNGDTRPENALGGTSPGRTEFETLIFADNSQTLQTLSFKTAAPVTISGYNLYLGQDAAANGNIRGFDTVAVFGSLDGIAYTNLGGIDLTNPYQNGYGSTSILVTSTFNAATYQYFRFEGAPYDQGSFSEVYSGGRIFELDAISGTIAAVPEPASWATMIVGFGAIGAGMRHRRRGAEQRYA